MNTTSQQISLSKHKSNLIFPFVVTKHWNCQSFKIFNRSWSKNIARSKDPTLSSRSTTTITQFYRFLVWAFVIPKNNWKLPTSFRNNHYTILPKSSMEYREHTLSLSLFDGSQSAYTIDTTWFFILIHTTKFYNKL